MRRRVMRRAEGPRGEDRVMRIREPRDAVDRAGGECFLFVERRKDRRKGARQHGLSGARRTDEQKIVAARRRDLQRPFRRLLPGDLGKVDLMPRLVRARWNGAWRRADAPIQMLDDLAQRAEAIRGDAAGRGLPRVLGCEDDLMDPARCRMPNTRHRTSHRTKRPVQRELAEAQGADVGSKLSAGPEDTESDRQVEACPFLAALCRSEVDRHATQREFVARVAHRRADAFAGFLYGCVGQADHDEGRQSIRDVDLNRDERTFEAPQCARGYARDRARGLGSVRRGDRDGRSLREIVPGDRWDLRSVPPSYRSNY